MWARHFFPYYIITFAGTAHLIGRLPSWRSLVIATTSFPSHLMALLSVVTRLDLRWSVTGEIRRATDYIQSVIPQILLLLLSAGAIPLLFLQREQGGFIRVLMAVWLSWNCALLFSLCRRALPSWDRSTLPALAVQPVRQHSL